MSELESEKAAAAAEVAEIDSDMDSQKPFACIKVVDKSDKSHCCLHKSVQLSSCTHGLYLSFFGF